MDNSWLAIHFTIFQAGSYVGRPYDQQRRKIYCERENNYISPYSKCSARDMMDVNTGTEMWLDATAQKRWLLLLMQLTRSSISSICSKRLFRVKQKRSYSIHNRRFSYVPLWEILKQWGRSNFRIDKREVYTGSMPMIRWTPGKAYLVYALDGRQQNNCQNA